MLVLEGEATRRKWTGPPAVVALGMFDGVHLGHQALIRRAVSDARRQGGAAIALTFEPHPAVVLAPQEAPQLLTLKDEKVALMSASGLDAVVFYPFTRELAAMAPEEFVRGILGERFRARKVVVGYNFTFGARGKGNTQLLSQLGESVGYELAVIPPVTKGRHAVSSSTIRAALDQGNVSLAARLLGRPFAVQGVVGHGEKRGRGMGFPTINLEVSAHKTLPYDGVYVVKADSPAFGVREGVAAVSTRPTFGGCLRTLEAHLLDYQGDLYGASVTVRFHEWIRGIRDFGGAVQLGERIAADVRFAREFFTR